MKYVIKKESPEAFELWKAQRKPLRWEDLLGKRANEAAAEVTDYSKAELRTALYEEQRHLCCYCNQRIADTAAGTAIDHIQPREGTTNQHLIFDYSNLGLSCKGGERDPKPRYTHCDNYKGSSSLPLTHLDPRCEVEIRYTLDGRSVGTSPGAVETIRVLNLSNPKLNALREGAIAGLIYTDQQQTELISAQDARAVHDGLMQLIQEESELPAFVIALVHALRLIME